MKLKIATWTAEEAVPIKYDSVDDFHEGLAAVELNGKWGFINEKGEEVVPLKYDNVLGFYGGFARVQLNDKWGFVKSTIVKEATKQQ